MATPNPKLSPESQRRPWLPPLENGDRLSRTEFERRYTAMPALKKAELIEGVVYVPSPVRFEQHGNPHAVLVGWLIHYCAYTLGVQPADNTTVRLDLDNEPQPDALLRILPEHGGQSHLDKDGYVSGPPELIAEVAASSASYDLHDKLKVYQRSGVREYIVWRVLDRTLDWFVLREGRYERLSPDPDGVLKSEVFPGLWLDAPALLSGDLAAVLVRLQEGIDSPEHGTFVAALKENAP